MLHIGQTNKSERRRFFPIPEFHKTHTHFLQRQPSSSAERKACGKNLSWRDDRNKSSSRRTAGGTEREADMMLTLSLNRGEKKCCFQRAVWKHTHKSTNEWLSFLSSPSIWRTGPLGGPWRSPKKNNNQKTNKRDSFLFLIHLVLVTIPRGEAPTLGCLVFPQICCPSRKPKNKYAENHKDKFGCLCGKAWSLGDYAHTQKKER